MENYYDFDQRAQMINELLKGLESAKQLQNQITNNTILSSLSNNDDQTLNYSSLIEKMMSTFDKSITIAKQINPLNNNNNNNHVQLELTHPLIVGSPISENSQPNRHASKRRKTMPRWTKTVKISPDITINGLEGPLNDGFSWRKYGQKGIFGAKFPRGYYRCTYKHTKSCKATKQVQQSDEDSSIYQVMYKGNHTCNPRPNNIQAQAQARTNYPPQPAESPPTNYPISHPTTHEVFLGLGPEGDVEIEPNTTDPAQIFRSFTFNSSLLEPEHLDNILNYSAVLTSPTTSGSNYFPTSSYRDIGPRFALNVQTSESDINSSNSGQNSVNNSPTTDDFEFPLEWLDIDPNLF
ncbi:hypothetical protein RND81_03G219800 [Saponaria officinalis]|uniref:WRKY domain-containing protein n=1 Tax=Saponaria officinalis TaxID=3572 RepID=A0AAW1M211_SAPOF